MYIKLDKRNGRMEEWEPPFEQSGTWKNGYFFSGGKGIFVRRGEDVGRAVYYVYSIFDRKSYEINLETNECREINREFDLNELRQYEHGFHKYSVGLNYACRENAFNSLPNFLDGEITGNQFDKDKSIRAYEKITANNDGTSGEKIYQFIYSKLLEQ